MDDKIRQEYENVLRRALFRNATVVDLQPRFGWQDYQATTHMRECKPYSPNEAFEDYWYEFVSMGGPEEGRRHGLTLTGVSCVCGQLKDRDLRWDDNVHAVAEAVFREAFGARR